MATSRYIPHNQDREDQKAEDAAERRSWKKAPLESEAGKPDLSSHFGGKNPNDEEYNSVESLVKYIMDNEGEEFDHLDLQCLCYRLRSNTKVVRAALEAYGLRLAPRAKEKSVRGFRSNPNTRFQACPSHGGGGGSSIVGIAGQAG